MAGASSCCGEPSAVMVHSGCVVPAVVVIPFSCQVMLGATKLEKETSNASRFTPGRKQGRLTLVRGTGREGVVLTDVLHDHVVIRAVVVERRADDVVHR